MDKKSHHLPVILKYIHKSIQSRLSINSNNVELLKKTCREISEFCLAYEGNMA